MATVIYSVTEKVTEIFRSEDPIIDYTCCLKGIVYLTGKRVVFPDFWLPLVYNAKSIFPSCIGETKTREMGFTDPCVFGIISESGVLYHLVVENLEVKTIENPSFGYTFLEGVPLMKKCEKSYADFYLAWKDGITSVVTFNEDRTVTMVSDPGENVVKIFRHYSGKNHIMYLNSLGELKDESRRTVGNGIKSWVSVLERGAFLKLDGTLEIPDVGLSVGAVKDIFGNNSGQWRGETESKIYLLMEDGRCDVLKIGNKDDIKKSELVLPEKIWKIKDCPLGTTVACCI
jgi:hypothetical protein